MQKNLTKAQNYIAEHKDKINLQYRNAFHLSAPLGWMNDPNGFVFYQGEYHLFYQYHPYSSQWGPMHWGHAKSKDLLHWEHLPVALAPSEDYDKDGCFSGSALVKDDQLFLLYTGHAERNGRVYETQCLATSSDGIHFEKSPRNPIIHEEHILGVADVADFRDPKIFEEGDRYYCVVASKTPDLRGQILLFQSKDLLNWQFYSVLLEGQEEQGVMWECPDLFFLDGKWVLLVSPIEMKRQGFSYNNLNSTVAFIGEMDWQAGQLVVENFHEVDGGMDFYAPQTCLDDRGNRIMVAWLQMWHRTIPTDELGHGWAGSMTLPRKLRIRENRLYQEVPNSIAEQNLEQYSIKDEWLEEKVFPDLVTQQQMISLKLSGKYSFTLYYPQGEETSVCLSYDASNRCLTLSRDGYGYALVGKETPSVDHRSIVVEENELEIQLIRDTSSLEVFVNGRSMTMTFYETERATKFSFASKGTEVHELSVVSLVGTDDLLHS